MKNEILFTSFIEMTSMKALLLQRESLLKSKTFPPGAPQFMWFSSKNNGWNNYQSE
jgi:hypothetical protein